MPVDMGVEMRVDMCVGMCMDRGVEVQSLDHNYIGHNYKGHNYMGHYYIRSTESQRRSGSMANADYGQQPIARWP